MSDMYFSNFLASPAVGQWVMDFPFLQILPNYTFVFVGFNTCQIYEEKIYVGKV